MALRFLNERQVGHLGNVYIFFYVAGFFFQGDQSLDGLGLNARVPAEKRRGKIIRPLRDVFVHLEQPRDHVDAFLAALADEAQRFDLRANDPPDLLSLNRQINGLSRIRLPRSLFYNRFFPWEASH